MPEGRLSIISCRLEPNSTFRSSSASAFEGHSEASDVLRELFKVIQNHVACQEKLQSFSGLSFAGSLNRPSAESPFPGRGHGLNLFAQRKYQNNQTPGSRTRSTQLLNISIRLQWLGFGFRSALASRLASNSGSTAIKHLDCAPSFP